MNLCAAETSEKASPMVRLGFAPYKVLLSMIYEIEDQLKEGKSLGFPYVIRADMADGHLMGLRPITFLRQVVSVCSDPDIADHMPCDVVQRAKDIISHCPGQSVGSIHYSDHPLIHQHIADYISERDSVKARPEDIWFTNGVTGGFNTILEILKRPLNGIPPGVLTCVPQYMCYFTQLRLYGYKEPLSRWKSALVRSNLTAELLVFPRPEEVASRQGLVTASVVCYYLDEDRGWAHDVDEMQKALDASKRVCIPRCLLLVNPSNPPCTVLSMQQLQDIIVFAHKNRLIILADEVFEHSTYDSKLPFCSVRKAINAMCAPYSQTPLISFNSISKGFAYEPGLRSAYFEAINLDPVDQANLEDALEGYRPCMLAQAALDCIVRPPQLGDPSYELYTKEKTSILTSLARRAKMAEERLNAIDGFHCGAVQGSVAAYPRVTIPVKAVEEAKRRNKEADVFYAEELLKAKGVSVVPSSAFGRIPGRYHFRIIILAPDDKLTELFDRLEDFHRDFMAKYG